MIRELIDYRELPSIIGIPQVVACVCDCCLGEFLFGAIRSIPKENRGSGPPIVNLAGQFFQFPLAKYCPFCGARNTQPRPQAAK